MASASEPVDVRADRAVQGAVTVITLGAFVFRTPWVIPILAVVLGAGALIGPAGNAFHRIFSGLIAPRLSSAPGVVPASTIQDQDILAAALLGLATLCILIGLGGFGWIVALGEGGVAVIAATTGVHLGVTVHDRIRKR